MHLGILPGSEPIAKCLSKTENNLSLKPAWSHSSLEHNSITVREQPRFVDLHNLQRKFEAACCSRLTDQHLVAEIPHLIIYPLGEEGLIFKCRYVILRFPDDRAALDPEVAGGIGNVPLLIFC